ncbi:MAG: hypothetical protein ABI609_16180 [Acidobacteriota bacterium]
MSCDRRWRTSRKQRNDVAFELRALIDEGLEDKAKTTGRAADAAMATELVHAFGRPEDVAARYRPTLTIVDPAEVHSFVRAAVILNVPWFIAVIVKGRWSVRLRQVEAGLGLVTCAALVWTILGGPVFMAPASDGTAKLCLMLIVLLTLIGTGVEMYRRVRPTPS